MRECKLKKFEVSTEWVPTRVKFCVIIYLLFKITLSIMKTKDILILNEFPFVKCWIKTTQACKSQDFCTSMTHFSAAKYRAGGDNTMSQTHWLWCSRFYLSVRGYSSHKMEQKSTMGLRRFKVKIIKHSAKYQKEGHYVSPIQFILFLDV